MVIIKARVGQQTPFEGQISQDAYFIHEVLLEHRDTHCFYIIYGCLTSTKAELSSSQSVKHFVYTQSV